MHDYEFWTAVGTVSAVAVALLIALAQAVIAIVLAIKRGRQARRKVASLVSSWIEVSYAPNATSEYYRRTVKLHIANESDEPVFKVQVICGIDVDDGVLRLGPLAAPAVIPTLPPKREFVYDITMGALGFGEYAHDSFHSLVAEVAFEDHQGKRWERGFAGDVVRLKKPKRALVSDGLDSLATAQAGPVDNHYNPLNIVFGFLSLAADDQVTDEDFHHLLMEQAGGWKETSPEKIGELRKMLSDSNLAPHVWYPAPRVAYVRLPETLPGEDEQMRMTVLTLVWREKQGWTFFGVGATQPWEIGFGPGELRQDPLDGRVQTP